MIWLIPLIDDSQNVHITKLEAKKKTHNNNNSKTHKMQHAATGAP
jgi:hypothetical protein